MRPKNVKYSKSHEWVRVEDNLAIIGITDFAVGHLSDLVYVDLPDLGTDLMANEPFGEIESVKAVSDLYCPVTGEVVAQNEALHSDLTILNKDPFGAGWMIKVRMEKPAELEQLLDAAGYEKIVKDEESRNH